MLPLIYHPIYSDLPLPEGHRYPIMKYKLLYDAVNIEIHLRELDLKRVRFFQPQAMPLEGIAQCHDSDYINQLSTGDLPAPKMRRIGFPWSEQLIKRTLTSTSGTVMTVQKAIEQGIAIHLSGGYHHAHANYGSGFCLFNDLVVAANEALKHSDVDSVMIIDSDVHHGDGTATLCAENSDITTVSFHCDKNFPARKPNSDIDVPLAKGTTGEEFLASFTSVVEMAVNLYRPDLILYDAGVDIHEGDELGFLAVSTEAIYQRDRFMLEFAIQRNIPIAAVVGGGYRSDHRDLVPIHMQLFKAAFDLI
ncbi:histone deacetylase family protein [Vibrio comitans]|uniref:Histone deacetylase n=1 Tax=Vibrio comitans NBRC 102076 TaxID=1219078 RepID=A0A4Y3IL28_9VIBR|nr:histone deacetylase [Vibrio comitans]GEA59454.1 histone deacetylase [Vibrio comitans NBRC 102076]